MTDRHRGIDLIVYCDSYILENTVGYEKTCSVSTSSIYGHITSVTLCGGLQGRSRAFTYRDELNI